MPPGPSRRFVRFFVEVDEVDDEFERVRVVVFFVTVSPFRVTVVSVVVELDDVSLAFGTVLAAVVAVAVGRADAGVRARYPGPSVRTLAAGFAEGAAASFAVAASSGS